MGDLVHFVINVGTALVLGMVIGLERQFRQHPAGLRTNALVSLGAALFVSLALAYENETSPTRMASYVVSGIGFLGGGVILREGFNVRGMNTAATLWCSAAVGTLAGMGFPAKAAIGAGAVLLVHLSLRPLVQRIEARIKTTMTLETAYRIRVVCEERDALTVRTIFTRHINAQPHMTLQGISTQDLSPEGKTTVEAHVLSGQQSDKYMNELVGRIGIEPGVTGVSWEKLGEAGGEQ